MRYTIEERWPTRAPREALWRVLEDLPQWPAFVPYIVSLRREDGREERPGQHWLPGTVWIERVRRGLFVPRFRLMVTGLTPGRYVEWTARYLWVEGAHGWGLEDRGDGWELVSRETFTGPAPLVWIGRALFRLFRVRGMTREQLAAMAERAESMREV